MQDTQKILLFGGAFDPLHNGHIALLKNSIKLANPNKVIIMPSGLPPHKNMHTANANVRCEMCSVFLPIFNNTVIDTYEIDKKEKSYTIDTLKYISSKYDKCNIFLSVGSDMLLSFHLWKEYVKILELVTIIVHCRNKEDLPLVKQYVNDLSAKGANILISSEKVVQISSSQIREFVAKGVDISKYVPKHINNIIKNNNLYM